MAEINLSQFYEIINKILNLDADLTKKEIRLCFGDISKKGASDRLQDNYYQELKYSNGQIVIQMSKDEEVMSIFFRPDCLS